jgi:membrane associated rhomboid family serine protease
VVRLRETEDTDAAAFRRLPRLLPLVSNQFVEPNVFVGFLRPVRVPKFKYGSEQLLAISAKERRRGQEFDAFAVTADDPDGLFEALIDHGARRYDAISDLLTDTIGLASGAQQVVRRREDEAMETRERRKGVMWAAFGMAALLVRFLVPEDGPGPSLGAVVTICGSAIVFAALAAFAVSRFRPDPPARRPVKDVFRRRDQLLVVVLPLVGLGLFAGGISAISYIGTDVLRRVLWGALFGGFGGGLLIGPLFIRPRQRERQRSSSVNADASRLRRASRPRRGG